MREEVGKPDWEAFSGDILPLLAACSWHERHAKAILAPRRVRGTPIWMFGQRHRSMRAPLGRVAIIATWNYPVQLLGIQMLQALAAGNDVVVKPSERSPRSQAALVDLANRAGLPAGTLELRSHTREAGRELLARERFDHIVFTGSTRVGENIARAAAETLTPTTLELSGCDSALVLDDADPGLAARSLWLAMSMNAGQTCMAPRRALVDRRVYTRFLSELAPLAAAARPVVLIDAPAAQHVQTLVVRTLERGARTLTGVIESPMGRSMRPVVLADCPPDAPLVNEEHFGPALAVVPVSDVDEMLRVHARQPKALSASIFTGSAARGSLLSAELGASIITINDCVLPTAHPAAGLSGRGQSGWGVSRGPEGLLAMTRPVHIASTGTRVRTPPEVPSPAVAGNLTKFLTWWYGRSH